MVLGGDFLSKVSVLIIDNNVGWCNKLKDYLGNFPIYEVIKPVHKGNVAIEVIESYKPDIIILDLVLEVYDGFYIMDYITNIMPGYKPAIYIITATATEITQHLLSTYNIVALINLKPIELRAIASGLQRIRESISAVIQPELNPYGGSCTRSASQSKATGFELQIENYLTKLGLETASLSTRCTIAAIMAVELFVKADGHNKPLISDVCEKAGQAFNPMLASNTIEQNVRISLDIARDKNTPLFNSYFAGNSTITIKTFLYKSLGIIKILGEMEQW